MRFLRTNTAIRLTVGPFLDKTDGVTPEVALTVTSCKLTLVVDDANVPTLVLDVAPTASGGANDMVHVTGDDAGFYDLELAAANVNYLGRAMLAITDAATHCPVFHELMVLPAMIYDSLVLGTDRLDTNVTHVSDTAQTARDIGASVLLSSGTGTGQLKLASGYVAMTWADVAAPTTTVALTGTTIAVTQKVDVETIKTNPVVNAGTVTFPTTATLASTTNITGGTITTVTTTTTATNVTTVNGIATGVINAAAVAADAGSEIAAAILDLADAIESGLTVRGALRLALSVLAAKLSGAGTTTEVFRNAVADSKNRITATVDASGNRTAIVTDVT